MQAITTNLISLVHNCPSPVCKTQRPGTEIDDGIRSDINSAVCWPIRRSEPISVCYNSLACYIDNHFGIRSNINNHVSWRMMWNLDMHLWRSCIVTFELNIRGSLKFRIKKTKLNTCQTVYSRTSPKRTPSGPRRSVRLREVAYQSCKQWDVADYTK